ncbi:Serine/threonine-protein phosphatase [Hondaea fermentalgiana]|uniref:Serine/threonine-protein phosphatase n=1 Tax=Hondaea fermentalgiana TaxID=2315210 RepID=A0A2R5G5T7_9STRA|nr:Serine/threonine-protein phosphatase [Hondaea fermentalgiana]|eukprot:GBG26422.1 Serine/threonine-protein phosphatase [Hondaea fermentalgiana]
MPETNAPDRQAPRHLTTTTTTTSSSKSCSPSSTSLPRGKRVGYLTDVEGHLDFFCRSVQFSSVLELTERSSSAVKLEFKDADASFVYGGDVCDHGPGDIRVSRALVDLKNRYPDRVFILAGNRDINKLRLSSELWRRFDKDPTAAVNFLKMMLQRTMGSPNAFESRRQELTEMNGNPASDVDVVASFCDAMRPGGYMISYLEAAQLGALVGDTLFVHGAVPAGGLGFVPTTRRDGFYMDEPRAWISRLNEFYADQLAEWAANPEVRSPNANGDLVMDYSRPGGIEGRGVVYNDWLEDDDTIPASIPQSVAGFLHRGGIRRVVSGHRPHGETPTVIRRSDDPELVVITADTSYSDPEAADTRGQVVCEVVVTPQETCIRGHLKDGTEYAFVVEDHPELGYRLENGGHVKAVVPDGVLVCHSAGPGTYSSDMNYELLN